MPHAENCYFRTTSYEELRRGLQGQGWTDPMIDQVVGTMEQDFGLYNNQGSGRQDYPSPEVLTAVYCGLTAQGLQPAPQDDLFRAGRIRARDVSGHFMILCRKDVEQTARAIHAQPVHPHLEAVHPRPTAEEIKTRLANPALTPPGRVPR